MANKMLIDSTHPEETRVVVTRGNRVEEFDFESASRKQLRGNIYLAKVTRVEPSLQAAFVDFGGNRHGFLAFSEIHPDYYQIPVADREALIAEEIARAQRDEEDDDNGRRNGGERSENSRNTRGRRDRGRGRNRNTARGAETGETVSSDQSELASGEPSDHISDGEEPNLNDTSAETGAHHHETEAGSSDEDRHSDHRSADQGSDDQDADNGDDGHHEEDVIEQMGGGDALEDLPARSYMPRRQYKIQEVIKRRQILLVQVVKEERGNKGAALTTYLSLAGRYSVLMPNTARGGGVSRKITNGADRKRLKELVGDLEVPEGMGVILRTAGAARTKPEIKRDFEYLLRVWEKVRELTLQSTAPALVYEEGSLVKRAIRDLYSKDIDDIQVSGEGGYREAKDFMRMLMPSHAKMVQLYRDGQPLFARYGVEAQLDAMFNSNVTLRSGGYIVINQTEALVSIDVNSGRSTREHNIEDTALKTNLEAAEEVARQLRLRDLAGLVVIDFIDMEENRNNRAVERRLKDCLKDDRARIQIGRISAFGLMEMSRQRIRAGVLESSTVPCAHCGGTGLMRATPSIALQVLRAVEDALLRIPHHNIIVRTRTEIALYVLNHKRANLAALEAAYGVSVLIQADETVMGTTYYVVERGEFIESASLRPLPTLLAPALIEEEDPEIEDDLTEEETEEQASSSEEREASEEDGNGRKRGRRRRRRGGGRDREEERGEPQNGEVAAASDEEGDNEGSDAEGEDENSARSATRPNETEEEANIRRRRRRRRGGRRNRRDREPGSFAAGDDSAEANGDSQEIADGNRVDDDASAETSTVEPMVEKASEELPVAKPRRGRPRKIVAEEIVAEAPVQPADTNELVGAKPAAKRGRKPKVVAEAETVVDTIAEPIPAAVVQEAPVKAVPPAPEPMAPAPAPVVKTPRPAPVIVPEIEDPNRPKRTGWWAKAKQALGGE